MLAMGTGWRDGGICAVSRIPERSEKRGELQILMLIIFF